MREIKFRAWDKTNGKFLDLDWNDYYLDIDVGELYEIEERSANYLTYMHKRFMKDAILMQYTGLTDQNGKEIYEGDIVTAREKSNTATFTGYVHFLNGQYWVNYIGYESYYVPLIQLVNAVYEPIEIVGNMYQDNHLLDKNVSTSHD